MDGHKRVNEIEEKRERDHQAQRSVRFFVVQLTPTTYSLSYRSLEPTRSHQMLQWARMGAQAQSRAR